jgi:BirA family biotin operon repressor/biotin-[acetyl-CoA-carboxylase] ligase
MSELPDYNQLSRQLSRETFDVIAFDTVISTQDVARATIQAYLEGTTMPKGVPNLTGNTVIRAAEQQSGRGRRARDWYSAVGGSYQTLLFAPPLDNNLDNKPAVTLWVAVGLAKALNEQGVNKQGVQVMVKWPNDLYIDGKKVAGMLCEWCRNWLLVGVGVNVANIVPETATRLELPLEQVHESVIAGAAAGVRDWQKGDKALGETFAAWDFLYGKQVTVQTGKHTTTGVARGVNAQGCLLLDTPCCDGHVLDWVG